MGQTDDGDESRSLDRSPVRSTTFTPGVDDPLLDVTELLAREYDVSPLELTPPLGAIVDWDAVTALFAHTNSAGIDFIRFTYDRFEIEVRGDGRVLLFPLDS